MRLADSSDDDGFEEAVLEIRSFDRVVQQDINYLLPSANPIFSGNGDFRGETLSSKLTIPATGAAAKKVFVPDPNSQTLWERYQGKNYRQVYLRNEPVVDEPKINFTSLYQHPSTFTQKRLFTKKKGLFDSNFESGNLCAVYYHKDGYDLIMHNDSNTRGYTQWFNFLVRDPKPPRMNIRIVNFLKSHSHFKHGMQPIITSDQRCDYPDPLGVEVLNIRYRRNDMIRLVVSNVPLKKRDKLDRTVARSLYTLSFELKYPPNVPNFYVSMNYPYPLTRLSNFLKELRLTQTLITNTLLGNTCSSLLITDGPSQGKRRVVIIARQHPGETVSSFVMEGVLKYLTSQSPEARWLKQQAEFVVVPMVNVDGVQLGNFRCSSTGTDLNRIWNKPNAALHPEIHKLKSMISKYGGDIDFFIDLHGHSKKMNTFLYGCRHDSDPVACRVFPKIFESLCPFFRFEDCTFSISKHKLKTARAIIYTQLSSYGDRPRNVFTIETSFFGYSKEARSYQHTIEDMHDIGKDLLRSIFAYWGGHLQQQELQQPCLVPYAAIDPQRITEQLQLKAQHYQEEDEKYGGGSDNEQGSDSEAELDMLEDEQQAKNFFTTPICQSEHKRNSKSISQPPQSRALRRDSELNKLARKSYMDETHRVPAIVSSEYQASEVKTPIKDMRSYFPKRKPRQVELTQTGVVSMHHNKESQLEPLRNKPSTPTQQTFVGSAEFAREEVPCFQITRQQFKRQLEGMIPNSQGEQYGYFPPHMQIQAAKIQPKMLLPTAKVTEIGSQSREKQSGQITDLQQFVFDLKTKNDLEKGKEPTKLGRSQNQRGSHIQTEDTTMSQVLRNIWLMNQMKYGLQLQQPKPIRSFQKKTPEDEDVKLFDDRKMQGTSRRFIVKKQQPTFQEYDKLFPYD